MIFVDSLFCYHLPPAVETAGNRDVVPIGTKADFRPLSLSRRIIHNVYGRRFFPSENSIESRKMFVYPVLNTRNVLTIFGALISRRPFAAFATVVFSVAESAVVAQNGRDFRRSAPFAAFDAVVFAVAEAAVVAQPGWNLCRTAPSAALAAVVFFVAESAVAA